MGSTLKMRYGGQIVSLTEGFNFNANYGTAKLNIKVDSSSTMKLGLTTNTNAKEYCKLKVRVNGQQAYIGRVSSTTYTSGQVIDRNGSVVASSSTSTSSSSYTGNAGSGDGSGGTNPGIRTITNATGSSVTTRTASAQIATQTVYSYSGTRQTKVYFGSFDKGITYTNSMQIKTGTVEMQAGSYGTLSSYSSTTKYFNSERGPESTQQTTVRNEGGYGITDFGVYFPYDQPGKKLIKYYIGLIDYSYIKSGRASVTVSDICRISTQYVHHYNYSTRYSYWWTSCSIYTNYTTSVSETLHNMNI